MAGQTKITFIACDFWQQTRSAPYWCFASNRLLAYLVLTNNVTYLTYSRFWDMHSTCSMHVAAKDNFLFCWHKFGGTPLLNCNKRGVSIKYVLYSFSKQTLCCCDFCLTNDKLSCNFYFNVYIDALSIRIMHCHSLLALQ